MTSNAITKSKDQMGNLKRLLEEAKPSMAAVLPKHLTPDRMAKLALVAASRNPLLLQCDAGTVLHSVMNAAQLGLDCGGVLGAAYLVPFKNNKTNPPRMECQLIVGYRGLIDLARRSGQIETIEANVVYQNDTFEFELGLEPKLRHVPKLDGDRGKVVLVYAIARLRDGGRQTEVMSVQEIERIRAKSRAANGGPWVSDWNEMARKTVIKRIIKYLPMSVDEQDAISRVDAIESIDPVIDISTLPEEPIEPPTATETIAAKVTGAGAAQDVPLFDRDPGQEG